MRRRDGKAVVLDTRKTLPGWRVLQKYAVRCGGGTNHRMGLYDGILIKDNHLAGWFGDKVHDKTINGSMPLSPLAAAIRHVRHGAPNGMRVEIEVDSLEQLADALQAQPDIILLDNFDPERMREAVTLRNQNSPERLNWKLPAA